MQKEFQQQLMQSQIEVQEQTFITLSQELHDNVGQLLGSAKMLIGITGRNLPQVPDTLKTADETIAKAIADLRSLSKSMNKEWLHHFSLVENLEAESQRINAAREVQVNVMADTRKLLLENDRQVMLFRIIQEAMQNSMRHGKAQHIRIQIETINDMIEVKVADDGIGFDTANPSLTGVGIIHLQQRTRLLNGEIEWQSKPGAGTVVAIRVPNPPIIDALNH